MIKVECKYSVQPARTPRAGLARPGQQPDQPTSVDCSEGRPQQPSTVYARVGRRGPAAAASSRSRPRAPRRRGRQGPAAAARQRSRPRPLTQAEAGSSSPLPFMPVHYGKGRQQQRSRPRPSRQARAGSSTTSQTLPNSHSRDYYRADLRPHRPHGMQQNRHQVVNLITATPLFDPWNVFTPGPRAGRPAT